MIEKNISVPLRHYLVLTTLGLSKLMYYTEHTERTPDEELEFARLVRWEQWHEAADERGLTR